MATLVGTVPNAYLAAFLADRAYGLDITFVSWMMLALPVVLIMM
jgi:di/tricarboxylate transporter|tara:strand:- start:314 stop:445 length:132 start_codon:yes stop_codon:yes gene_type:complete